MRTKGAGRNIAKHFASRKYSRLAIYGDINIAIVIEGDINSLMSSTLIFVVSGLNIIIQL